MPFDATQLASLIACGLTPAARCCISLPGGAQLCSTSLSFDPMRQLQPYIDQLNAALAPLMPIFRIIAVAVAIINCIKAIPDSIPIPTPIIQCLVELVAAAIELLKLIPLISLPFTLIGILDCIILFLRAIRQTIAKIVQLLAGVNLVINDPFSNATQLFIARCELGTINAQLANLNNILAALGALFGVVNLLLGLLQLQELPTSLSIGTDASAALDAIDAILVPLTFVRSLIPVG